MQQMKASGVIRVPANRIEPDDLAGVVETWLDQPWRKGVANPGGMPRKEIEELIGKLRHQKGPDGKPLDTGVVLTMAIGFALSVMYPGAGGDDTGFGLTDPNAA